MLRPGAAGCIAMLLYVFEEGNIQHCLWSGTWGMRFMFPHCNSMCGKLIMLIIGVAHLSFYVLHWIQNVQEPSCMGVQFSKFRECPTQPCQSRWA